jgi:hypothetical protein
MVVDATTGIVRYRDDTDESQARGLTKKASRMVATLVALVTAVGK